MLFTDAGTTGKRTPITLPCARAGESLNFQIRDVDSTFRGFAGADYDIADSLENADEIIKGTREVWRCYRKDACGDAVARGLFGADGKACL